MNETVGIMGMPGVGFFGMLLIGGLAGWIAEKVRTAIMGCSRTFSSALPALSSAARWPASSVSIIRASSATHRRGGRRHPHPVAVRAALKRAA